MLDSCLIIGKVLEVGGELRGGFGLVRPERPGGEYEAEQSHTNRHEVESCPEDTVGDHGCCRDRGDNAANTIGAVSKAQDDCRVRETATRQDTTYISEKCDHENLLGAEDVVEGEIHCIAEALFPEQSVRGSNRDRSYSLTMNRYATATTGNGGAQAMTT